MDFLGGGGVEGGGGVWVEGLRACESVLGGVVILHHVTTEEKKCEM